MVLYCTVVPFRLRFGALGIVGLCWSFARMIPKRSQAIRLLDKERGTMKCGRNADASTRKHTQRSLMAVRNPTSD
jgi:hypothetical protein